jgi:hypothetical protein
MAGLGILVAAILFILILYIFFTHKASGFENPEPGPAPESVTGKKTPVTGLTGLSDIADLPSAPINSLGQTNSLPYEDPANVKSSNKMLNELKGDMDGFASFELPNMPDTSDPSIKLPLTRFKGDYQRVKDELNVINNTPGLQTQVSVQELNAMAANLRFIQRTYRTYADSELVPAPKTPLSSVGVSEGFFILLPNGTPCSRSQQCQSGACNYGVTPHKCVDPSDFTNSVGTNQPGVNSDPNCPAGQYSTVTGHPCSGPAARDVSGNRPSVVSPPPSGNSPSDLSGNDFGSSVGHWTGGYTGDNNSGSQRPAPAPAQQQPSLALAQQQQQTPLTSTPNYVGDPNVARITPTQLQTLLLKLSAEINRLQQSGSTDPVIQARVNIFTKIYQSLTDLNNDVKNGRVQPNAIPIKVSDYNNFLPALGSTSTGVPSLFSNTNLSTPGSIASMIASYFGSSAPGAGAGADASGNRMLDASGNPVVDARIMAVAAALMSGLSYNVSVNYTSPNDVAKSQAEAVKAMYESQQAAMSVTPGFDTNHPMTMDGARGAFDSFTRQLDLQGFQSGRPVAPVRAPGTFDWKKRSNEIYENVKRAGMNPSDYGFSQDVYANSASSDFSWRGYTKMVCNRLATNVDNGFPEQMGCPPASWKGWRS